MFRSFRFRLVALSMLVSAVALFAFAGLAWFFITGDQEARFQLQSENYATRYAQRLLITALRATPGETSAATTEFLEQLSADVPLYAVVRADGQVLLRSNQWPNDDTLKSFAHDALPRNAFRPGPGEPPNGRPFYPSSVPPPNPPPAGADRPPPPGGAADDAFGPPPNDGFSGGPPPPDDDQPNGGGNPPFPGPSEGNPPPNGPRGPGPPRGGFAPLRLDHITYFTWTDPSHTTWRLAIIPGPGYVVVTGLSRTQLEAARARMANVFLIALAASLALIGVGSAVLAGRAVAPVRRLTLAAERITAEALHERIPRDRGPTEFARLVEVFNDMLDRLGLSFDQARRFSHDAAHELNTPLTVLMGQIDQALHDAPAGSPEQQRWAVLAEEVQRLRDIVRKLLVLARADRGALQPDTQWVDLARIARDCAEDAAAASPLLDISVNGETELPMDGDPSLLRQLVFNLISNATKYNRPGGFVRVRIVRERRDDQPRAVIEVTNAGHAIPLENAARVFDRFFRGDPARNRAVEGLGLGLSLAREFARAHGGDLTLASNSGDNITFRLELPVREE